MSYADGLASAMAQAIMGTGHPLKLPELMGELTLTGTYVMTNQSRTIQKMDPGGASRTVQLPPEEDGLVYWFVNGADAAENLVIKDDSGVTTVGTVNQNESGIFFCAGTTWKLMAIIAIALS